GQIYSPPEAEAALGAWFQTGNLSALRELTLLWLAATLASDPRRHHADGRDPAGGHARERVVVALSGGPEGKVLIRRAARIACPPAARGAPAGPRARPACAERRAGARPRSPPGTRRSRPWGVPPTSSPTRTSRGRR